jgi:predicted amidophosphoribosyltransferase
MVFCSKCGKDLPENAYFCPTCGVRTGKGAEANVPMPYGDMFSEMGKEIEKAFLTASEEMKKAFDKVGEELRRATSREPIVCRSCGEKNSVRSQFCSKCGRKLS